MKPVRKPAQSDGNNTLLVSVQNRQISTSDGYRYKLSPKFLYLYYYLALMRVEDPEHGGLVSAHQIVTLPHWERPTIVNAGKDVWRHIREMESISHNIIESTGQKTKGPFRIKYPPEEIQIDVPPATLMDILELIHIPTKLDDKEQSSFYKFAELLLDADIYFQKGLLPNALELYDNAARVAINPIETIVLLLKKGRTLAEQCKWQKAYETYQEILNLKKAKTLNDWEEASAYSSLGWMRYRQDKLNEAERLFLRALNIIRGKKYYRIMGDIYNGLGLIRRSRGLYPEALGFYQRALEYSCLEDYFYGIQGVYFNIGHIYRFWGDIRSRQSKSAGIECYGKGIKWVMRCISLCERMGIAYHTSQDHILLADLYLKINRPPDQALEIAGTALDVALTAKNGRDIAFSYRIMGNIYTAIKEKDLAISAYQECIKYLREIGLKERIKDIEDKIKQLSG